jgi:hypothetical protein
MIAYCQGTAVEESTIEATPIAAGGGQILVARNNIPADRNGEKLRT